MINKVVILVRELDLNNLVLTLGDYALAPLRLRLLLLGCVVNLPRILNGLLVDELLGVLLVCQFLLRGNV